MINAKERDEDDGLDFTTRKKYSKSNHINELKLYNVNILEKLNFIYDQVWENQGKNYPYEILTQLLDSYYVLPLRPDLASLFCWQAINHSYNAQQLKDVSKTKCTDFQGIELIQKLFLQIGTKNIESF